MGFQKYVYTCRGKLAIWSIQDFLDCLDWQQPKFIFQKKDRFPVHASNAFWDTILKKYHGVLLAVFYLLSGRNPFGDNTSSHLWNCILPSWYHPAFFWSLNFFMFLFLLFVQDKTNYLKLLLTRDLKGIEFGFFKSTFFPWFWILRKNLDPGEIGFCMVRISRWFIMFHIRSGSR